ncbi:hypothetical protein D3C86_868130 [compost metagenome]
MFNSVNKEAYFLKTSAKYTSTIAPKIIGSETFIIVAFKCTESKTPAALASAIALAAKAFSLLTLKTELSIISPALSGVLALRTVVVPSFATNSIFTSLASFTVNDFSLP